MFRPYCFDRPLSEEEESLRMPVVISCNEMRREVLTVQNIGNKQIDRTFVFDKVLYEFYFYFFFLEGRFEYIELMKRCCFS